MDSDARISYWRKGQKIQNYGDFLSELLFHVLSNRPGLSVLKRPRAVFGFDVIHLVGSVISSDHIMRGLEHARSGRGKKIAFWGCGMRTKERPPDELLEHCAFFGVRGPLTKQCLGLAATAPVGDPGLLLRWIYKPTLRPEVLGKRICVPHFSERKSESELLALSGCDLVLRPNIEADISNVFYLIDAIFSARFVLAGALHAAITAFAYKRPFAYFDSGFIDIPFKWSDFAASIEMPCAFAKNASEGEQNFAQFQARLRMPDVGRLLTEAPFYPPRSLLKRVASQEIPQFMQQSYLER